MNGATLARGCDVHAWGRQRDGRSAVALDRRVWHEELSMRGTCKREPKPENKTRVRETHTPAVPDVCNSRRLRYLAPSGHRSQPHFSGCSVSVYAEQSRVSTPPCSGDARGRPRHSFRRAGTPGRCGRSWKGSSLSGQKSMCRDELVSRAFTLGADINSKPVWATDRRNNSHQVHRFIAAERAYHRRGHERLLPVWTPCPLRRAPP